MRKQHFSLIRCIYMGQVEALFRFFVGAKQLSIGN